MSLGKNTPNLENDNFWDVFVSLPNITRPNFVSPSIPSIEPSNLKGELLQIDPNDLNPKFKFYARRFNQLNKDQIADSSQIQSHTPRDDSETPGNQSSTLFCPVVIENTLSNVSPTMENVLLFASDLDIPIAFRKGSRTYTKHPIAKYISSKSLSNDPNWKLAPTKR